MARQKPWPFFDLAHFCRSFCQGFATFCTSSTWSGSSELSTDPILSYRRNLDIERPTYTNLNRLIAQIISSLNLGIYVLIDVLDKHDCHRP